MRIHYLLLAASLCACGDDGDDNETGDGGTCGIVEDVEVHAVPGVIQADGSVTIYGTVRFAPDVANAGAGELAVHSVLVADLEAQPTTTDFNYRSWSVMIAADRLAAFTVTAMDGSKSATLPVRVYLYGGCVHDADATEQPTVIVEPAPAPTP